MIRRLGLVLGFLAAPPASAALWSQSAQALDPFAASIDIVAANGSRVAHFDSKTSQLIVTKATAIDVHSLPEVLVSPDGRHIALTDSDGGFVGSFRIQIVNRDGETLPPPDFSALARRDYQSRPGVCTESPNAAAIAWRNDGQSLLVVVESPPHSSCPDLGAMRGYELDSVTGEILASYPEADFRRRFQPLLGPRLQPLR